MIDTFEISLITSYSIVDLLGRELGEKINFKNNFCKITNSLGQAGVRAINIKRLKNSDKLKIAIEINPKELLTRSASIELFRCNQENVEALRQVLNEVLELIYPYFSLKNQKWRLSRIDYAMQFHTPHVEMYTELESKGPIPYRFKGLQKPGSTYNKSKSSRINAYNKGNQLSKTNSPETLVREARELYRFEYQCLNPKYLYEKYNVNRSELFGLFREDIALSVLKTQHARHIKAGDYYTYDEAAKRINEIKGKRQQTKEQVLEVLIFLDTAGSYSNALQLIKNNSECVSNRFRGASSDPSHENLKDKFNEFIRQHLCKAGINPVLLPKKFDIRSLPNTYTRLFTA